MLNISLLFKKFTIFTGNNSIILRIKNAIFSEYCFYMNTNMQGDFQICINLYLILVIQLFLFRLNKKKNGKFSFLDSEISREKGNTVLRTVYRKPTFSGLYTHFESFLSTVYKFGMVYSLVYCCFRICSDWTKLYKELSFLKEVRF